MSLEKKLIYPTLEELDLLRKKFNSIVDIPYSKEIAKNNLYSQYDDPQIIIEKQNKKIEELQNNLYLNTYKIKNNSINSNFKINNSNYEINEEENNNNINSNNIKIEDNNINNLSMKDNNYNLSKFNKY